MPWFIELLNRPEDLFRFSQHRWTPKVPVVSAVLVRPSHSASLRKGSWSIQVFSVPGDAVVDIETIKYPKILARFVDDLNIIDALVH
jgi:hypothetical protein